MTDRKYWIDYAKAIGIILVVFGHVARGLDNSGISSNTELFKLIDSIIYSFHMPLFFFLSGFLFLESLKRRGPYILMLSKIDTLVYPYIIWGIIQGIVISSLASHGYANNHISIAQVFSLWKPLGQFWFLHDLFFIFLLSSILYSIVAKKYYSLILVSACLLYVYQDWLMDHFILGFLTRNFVFFSFGIFFSSTLKNLNLNHISIFYIVLLIFLGSQFYFHLVLGLEWTDKGIYSLILALVSITFIAVLSKNLSKSPNARMIKIGYHSMHIFLLHVFFASGARIALHKLGGIENFYIQLIFGTLLGIYGPILLANFIERHNIPYIFTAPISNKISSLLNINTK